MSAFLEKAVVQFGIDPLIADEYTPYELYLIGKQVQERNFREFENALTVAWHTEAFARQRRLPKLEKILKEVRKRCESHPGKRRVGAMPFSRQWRRLKE